MANFVINEDTLHYAAAFLERYEDKNPCKRHRDAQKELRELSDYLLEALYKPAFITVARKLKS